MDIKSREARSRNMSKIKGKNTAPEMYIRSLLYRQGLRFRVNYKDIEGKPDIYFPKYKTAVFVHGCYWHRHKDCKFAYTPKTNIEFWTNKLEGNRRHDENVYKNLNAQHIRILIIWECTIRKMRKDVNLKQQVINNAKAFITEEHVLYMEI